MTPPFYREGQLQLVLKSCVNETLRRNQSGERDGWGGWTYVIGSMDTKLRVEAIGKDYWEGIFKLTDIAAFWPLVAPGPERQSQVDP